MLDGPVDTLWVENLNTVLDDNRMLCLSNGQRIKLPTTIQFLFEVEDLKYAFLLFNLLVYTLELYFRFKLLILIFYYTLLFFIFLVLFLVYFLHLVNFLVWLRRPLCRDVEWSTWIKIS